MNERITLMGCSIDNLSMEETLQRIEGFVHSGQPHQHVVVNVDKLVKASRDAGLRRIINACALVNVDGMSERGWRVCLLGARPRPAVRGDRFAEEGTVPRALAGDDAHPVRDGRGRHLRRGHRPRQTGPALDAACRPGVVLPLPAGAAPHVPALFYRGHGLPLAAAEGSGTHAQALETKRGAGTKRPPGRTELGKTRSQNRCRRTQRGEWRKAPFWSAETGVYRK